MILASHGIIGSQITQFVGLLDTYSGAAAAYSLRVLRSAYTGSAIRVRIDTTGQPEYNIGFVDNELDVATLEGYCTGGLNAYVKTWYDQSGNGYDATQTTAANQPQIVNSGNVILENGKPSVQFDGSDDYLENSTLINEQTISFITVYYSNITVTTTVYGRIAAIRATSLTGKNTFAQAIDYTLRYDGAFDSGTLTASTGYKLRYSQRDGTNVLDYINNSENINVANTLPNVVGYINIGRTQASLDTLFSHDGTFQEMVLYTTSQSTNRTGIESNINSFYSIY